MALSSLVSEVRYKYRQHNMPIRRVRTCNLGLYFSLKDEVPVTCSTSIDCGISTWRTVPKNPSSSVLPGVGSGLIFIL